MKSKVSVSILTLFKDGVKNVDDNIKKIERHADFIHFDIMDGKFVPSVTIGPKETAMIKTHLPKDVHLMCNEPIMLIDDYEKAGASMITIHVEACSDVKKTIEYIKKKGIKPTISLKPKTPVSEIIPYLGMVNMVLVMTVEPGWPRQSFMVDMMEKVKEIRKLKPHLDIQVDGGINDKTVKIAKRAGANVFVSGSYIFDSKDPVHAIKLLKEAK